MAFNFFSKSGGEKGPVDVKGLRDAILRFIKEALQKVEGGEGRHIKELLLYLAPMPTTNTFTKARFTCMKRGA
jgi:hypothetical protein